MKNVKIISAFLILAMIGCIFIACDSGDDVEVNLPQQENFYELTVSFQIKDSTGKTQVEAKDYVYKSHAEPTVLNIVDTYLAVVQDWTCKIDKNNTITQIGGMKINKSNGDYWGFVDGAIDLSKDQILKDLSDDSMSSTIVEDGGKFTVMLITG